MADRPGIVMGQRYTPIQRVGVCVPRSPEAFPSTILMNVIPARIAGVSEIYVVTPPRPDGSVSAEALAAATRSQVVQVIGTKFVLYRQNTNIAKRKIELVKATKKRK